MNKFFFKKIFKILFILFLFFYISIIALELFFSTIFFSLQSVLLLCLGFLIGIFFHLFKTKISFIFLLIHIFFEFLEYISKNKIISIDKNLFLYIFNFVLDCVFLEHEFKIHFLLKKIKISLIVFLVVLANFAIYYFKNLYIDILEKNFLENLHNFVLGGVLGCVLAHLIFHFKKEKF